MLHKTDIARGTFTPNQSLSILLVAKAQYKVSKSESLLPGTVEKRTIRRGGGKDEKKHCRFKAAFRPRVVNYLLAEKCAARNLNLVFKSSRTGKIAQCEKGKIYVVIMMMWGVSYWYSINEKMASIYQCQ